MILNRISHDSPCLGFLNEGAPAIGDYSWGVFMSTD